MRVEEKEEAEMVEELAPLPRTKEERTEGCGRSGKQNGVV